MATRAKYTALSLASMLENSDDEGILASDIDSEIGSDHVESGDEEEDFIECSRGKNNSDESDDTDLSVIDDSEGLIRGRNNFGWSSKSPRSSAYRAHNIIRVTPGLTRAVRDCESELDYFYYIIDDTMMRFILNCTNKRIPDEAKEIRIEELEGYIAISILLGLTKKRNVDISEIWNPSSCHYMDFCTLVMSRDRYKLISRFITFDDIEKRTNHTSHDKFYKMRIVFERFRSKIRTAFEPYSHLCVDEELYAFRGKCGFRQYLPSKPAKYGIKYFCINDVKTSYLLDVVPYLGRESSSANRAKNIGEQVVLDLAKTYFKTGRGVTTDNFFSSISLSENLWKNGMTHIGTLRKNKGEVPPSFLPKKQRPAFSSMFGFHNQLTIVSYVPKVSKAVILISSEHHSSSVEKSETKKPHIITTYNETKGAVDTFDKLVAGFSCRRYTNRWSKNCFFFMLDAAAYNSFVLYIERNPAVMTKNVKVQRRLHLEQLGMKLAENAIRQRVQHWKDNNFHSIKADLRLTATRYGYLEDSTVPTRNSRNVNSSGRCCICPRVLDRKCKNICFRCKRYVCKDHLKIICPSCDEL